MPTSVRLTTELDERLSRLSERSGRSKSSYLRALLEQNLERLEWEEGIVETSREIRAGQRPTVSAEVLRRELGLDS